MIAIPAVDLREGACVQLVGGEYAEERVRLDDPLAVAREWARLGFARLHVVDLDAALEKGSNLPLIREMLREQLAEVQVGGGLRTTDAVRDILDDGARCAIVGTRALEDLDWLAELAHDNPGQVIVAADVRDRRVTTRGWQRTLPRNVLDMVEEMSGLPLAALLVTAVHREGQLQGTDLPLMEDVVEAAAFPVFAAGGVSSTGDLYALQDRGVAGAVIGMALYTGAIDPRAIVEEFAA
ncbi:MAG TPA: 1-(5-phosphoribosyl)-5-[(5-phosphoribosylamino)methylideneamino] imidazole-4-carboxamide isomerase [Gemmatimonadaceae bacterium]|jgi:phosphoribosylformimino-5-aminoimidazole carboxamide ribotide isomerase|nr:MAG: 1-(5-phosphoribosyl)-5-((5-phosphoribosylamino)methylideneamino)imidazole-4-carboxamide isomerase [Gemmatimonadetes bacterium SCN 70-22]HMN07429.1 1-(5-phosphoribosyl)-5-[(5-phosphoribosylamino)methylideneamino] imidazole-4-carboxamide isomerase [Gemmatimonadaceae bacterium]